MSKHILLHIFSSSIKITRTSLSSRPSDPIYTVVAVTKKILSFPQNDSLCHIFTLSTMCYGIQSKRKDHEPFYYSPGKCNLNGNKVQSK